MLFKFLSHIEITTNYFDLAKKHHPDHGGEEAEFLKIHKAYRELKKIVKGSTDDCFVEAELTNRNGYIYKRNMI